MWGSWQCAGRCGAGTIVECSISCGQQEVNLDTEWYPELRKPQSHSPETQSLQQGHTHLNKVTPPNSATLYELRGTNYIQAIMGTSSVICEGENGYSQSSMEDGRDFLSHPWKVLEILSVTSRTQERHSHLWRLRGVFSVICGSCTEPSQSSVKVVGGFHFILRETIK